MRPKVLNQHLVGVDDSREDTVADLLLLLAFLLGVTVAETPEEEHPLSVVESVLEISGMSLP